MGILETMDVCTDFRGQFRSSQAERVKRASHLPCSRHFARYSTKNKSPFKEFMALIEGLEGRIGARIVQKQMGKLEMTWKLG